MEKDFNSLSTRLKFALKVLNLSQTDLAKKIDVKPQVIQYLCSSNSQKSKFTCEIAQALDIDFFWLATGKGAEPIYENPLAHEKKIPFISFNEIKSWKIDKNPLNYSNIINWIPASEPLKENSFAVAINDKSMAPRFDINTIIVIEPITEIISHNSFILVYLKKEDFIIFRQVNISNNDKLLIPINKKLHRDVFLSEEDFVLGLCKEARWSI